MNNFHKIFLCLIVVFLSACSNINSMDKINNNLVETKNDKTNESNDIIKSDINQTNDNDNPTKIDLFINSKTLSPFNDDNFIFCKELNTKAFICSNDFMKQTGAYFDVSQLDTGSKIIATLYKTYNLTVGLTPDAINNIMGRISIIGNDIYTWSFNNKIFIGMPKEDVDKLYGVPDSIGEDPRRESSFYYEYHLDNINLTITVFNNIVDEIMIDPNANVPILRCENYLSIYKIETSIPNSVGGVNLNIVFSNDSSKDIKYIYFNVTPYNAVGDIISSEIGDRGTTSFELTGPIEPTKSLGKLDYNLITRENAWYNANIKYAQLESVKIIYMDDEEVTLYVK